MCPFCQIVLDPSRAAVVAEEGHYVAFLDVRPLFPGHVLVVPKTHMSTLAELPDELLAPLFSLVRRVSAAMPKALGCEGTFVAVNNVVSQSVPHLHVHVVPRTKGDGLRGFFWPRTKYDSPEQMEDYRSRLEAALV